MGYGTIEGVWLTSLYYLATVHREIAQPVVRSAHGAEDLRRTVQYVEGPMSPPTAGLSEQRIGDCSRSDHE